VAAKPPAAAKVPAPPPPALRPAPAPVARAPVTAAERISPADHKHFEERLLEERGRLLKELGYLEANVLNKNPRDSSGDLSGYSFHMADAGTDAMEREKAFLFASTEGRALYDVDEALRRLYGGEYGICESCGKPIAPQRLEVVPHARLCITCKEKEEKAGRR
jgi:RNA polymerase-binding transcription factor DksA